MDKKEVGLKICKRRKEMGLTQKELAQRLHVTDKAVSKWETGTHFPDIAIMEDLSSVLGIRVVELLGLEQASSETMITEMALISKEEKISMIKQIRIRGWITIIIGVVLCIAMVYVSKVLADNHLFGLPQACTVGMLGYIGVVISNGIFCVYKSRKFLK